MFILRYLLILSIIVTRDFKCSYQVLVNEIGYFANYFDNPSQNED